MRTLFLAAACLFLAASGRAEEKPPSVDIYFPPELTVVADDYIQIEGRVKDPELYDIEITVNGEDTYRVFIRDLYFSEEVDLEAGENVITVGDDTRRVFYGDPEGEVPQGYEPAYGHFALDDGCLSCHELDGRGKPVFDDGPAETCAWCHNDLTRSDRNEEAVSVHRPIRDGECMLCHEPHISRRPFLLVEKVPPCRQCHAPLFEKLDTDRYVHGPVNLGDCRLCHTIHASPEPYLLNRSATSLCTDCHSEIAVKEGTPKELMPHKMIPEGECYRCHFAHSSEHPKLMRQPSSRVCYECHPENTKSFHEKKGFSIYVCLKCHDLHNPTTRHLIVDSSRSLCLECHDFSGEAVFTHAFVKKGGCFLCHSFHTSPLSEEIAVICLRCHGENPGLPEIHSQVPLEKARCTICHRPHQARREKLLFSTEHTPFRERKCEACHVEKAEQIGGDFRPLCLSCHREKDMESRPSPPKNVHPPFPEKDCSACHRSHASPESYFLNEEEIELCLGCHRKFRKITVMKPKSGHQFVIEGKCHTCHDSHFSEFLPLLKKSPREICLDCHQDLVLAPSGEDWSTPHPPVREGKCRLCHRPHTSRNPSLLRTPQDKVCRPCHQDLYKKFEDKAVRSRHKSFQEGKCQGCHNIHGSDSDSLLAIGEGDSLCARCHDSPTGGHHLYGKEEIVEKSGVSVEVSLCLVCHHPHSSARVNLLRPASSQVCKGCHKT